MSLSASQPELARQEELPQHHAESTEEARQKTFEGTQAADGSSDVTARAVPTQAVRFSSQLQEIEPKSSVHTVETLTADSRQISAGSMNLQAQAEIQNLTLGLQNSHLQNRRMSNFAFEPVSLPASRVPSSEQSPRHSMLPLPRHAGSLSSMHTPPLTPADSTSRDGQRASSDVVSPDEIKSLSGIAQMTPQTSNPQTMRTSTESTYQSQLALTVGYSRPSSSDQNYSPATTSSYPPGHIDAPVRQASQFSPEPSDSVASPTDHSPLSTPRPGSGTTTPVYSGPFGPTGDRDDPYARSKRPPQSRNLDAIDARFKFGGKDSRRHSGISLAGGALGSLPRSDSGHDLKSHDKHSSGFSLHALGKNHHLSDDGTTSMGKQHNSMADLKRFLRIGSSKRPQSPSSAKSVLNHKSGTRTPPHQLPPANVPFADDHGLQSKYGKFGKVLGSGAGGSVRLMKRSSDGVTFAVKQFRDRHNYESEREYAKKVTAEFCIGSTLHHGNIIETLDIIHEHGHWYEVMEFAPFDLFAIVMTGKMAREEVACSFLQIFAGVTYLHSMGLAHRDLKLDNVVVNDRGIMKLIDFGSATVFKYPFENDVVLATGVVGSDPYLAPEVYDNNKYDPQPTDIWSLAIIFACMSLRRFPWKAPRVTDNSYKLFATNPTTTSDGGVRQTSEQRPKSEMNLPSTEDGRQKSALHAEDSSPSTATGPSQHRERSSADNEVQPGGRNDEPKPEVIRGPWRLLRLLPRESRSIMGRMLEIDPKKRATLEEMVEDPWISGTPVCVQVAGGEVVPAPGHTHTLEPGTADQPTPSKK